MIRKVLSIIQKEWFDLFRSKGMMIFILYIFTLDVYIAGQGINIDAKNVNIGILDESGCSVYVGKIIAQFHEPEFKDIIIYKSRDGLYDDIKNKKIMAGLVFPADFDRNFADNKKIQIQLLLDSTVATISYYIYVYIESIMADFQLPTNLNVPINLKIHKLFNQNASAVALFSLKELIFAVTLLSIILSAAVFVKEKEQETWDLMLLMPINSNAMIFSKIISQVLIINFGFYLSLGLIIFGVFNIEMHGSLIAFFLLTFLYTIGVCGVGLFIASIAKNITQVGMLSMLALIPMDFLSEGFSPLSAKPEIIQWLSYLSPMRYYTIGMANLVFRGTEIGYLWDQFLGILVIAIILFAYGFRKIGRLF